MKIVIDIDENLYTRLFNNGNVDAMDMLKACVAIRKGTLLLKDYEKITNEVKPIIYGEWEYYEMGQFQCTNCGFIKWDATEFNFCPLCGADMRKEKTE